MVDYLYLLIFELISIFYLNLVFDLEDKYYDKFLVFWEIEGLSYKLKEDIV